MTNALYLCSAIGFLSVGAYRYFVSQGWDIRAFVKADAKVLLKNGLVTALLTYFAPDLANLLPADVFGVAINAPDALAKAPKFVGFALGAIGGGTDALTVLRNALELVPYGSKLIALFSKKQEQ